MTNIQKILKFTESFDDIKKIHQRDGCGKMWCSTCGGYGHAIIQSISRDDKTELRNLLTKISDNEYKLFARWHLLLSQKFPDIVNQIQKRIDKENQLSAFERINHEIDGVNTTNIKEVEKYLFYNRYNYINYAIKQPGEYSCYYEPEYYFPFGNEYYLIEKEEREKYQDKYARLLNIAIKNAIETEDYSLIESLAIILKIELKKYPELTYLCLKKCTDRLIYNCLGINRE